jgi:glycosyltransferase involved in cell wall biosynthesis
VILFLTAFSSVLPSLDCLISTFPNPLCEVTVLIPIYNKAHYLGLSIPSIFNLSIDLTRVCVLCYNDGSSDNSTDVVREYQRHHPSISLIDGVSNRGTLYSRIQLVIATRTPWLVFLDPDDEFFGRGMVVALDLIKRTDADIVQFGCRQVYRDRDKMRLCWREPRRIVMATARNLTEYWLNGRVDVHLHRKVWRTELFQRAIWSMPEELREKRILRTQDVLLYGHVLLQMKGVYRFIPTIGEIRHWGWPDNSQSAAYQPKTDTQVQMDFVSNWTLDNFGRCIRPG